jgi:hypothetical protein
MKQAQILYHLAAAVTRNPGAVITTSPAAFQVANLGRRYYCKAELKRPDGTVIESAIGDTSEGAISNLNTKLSLMH